MNVFDKLCKFDFNNHTGLINLNSGFFAVLVERNFLRIGRSFLIVVANAYEAKKLYNKFNSSDVILFLDDDFVFNSDIAISPEMRVERINTLNELSFNDKKIVITDMKGYLKKLPSFSSFKNSNIVISVDDSFSLSHISEKLNDCGYERCSVVSKMGDYAVRGFILDIYPINEDNPVRIQFFGDDVESIRYFDVDTQKSISSISSISMLPFTENFSDLSSNIYDYLDNPVVVYKDYEQVKFVYEKMLSEHLRDEVFSKYNDFYAVKVSDKVYYFDLDTPISCDYLSDIVSFDVIDISFFNENFVAINSFIKDALLSGKTIVIATSINNMNDFLEKLDFSYVVTDFDNIYDNKVNVVRKNLMSSFEISNYVFLNDFILFGKNNVTNSKVRFKNTSKIKDFSQISIGDYVVHSAHGIGIYNGMKVLSRGGVLGDYLEILYAKGDKLYIPASKIELISKYNGKDGYVPSINALSSTAWVKAKNRIRERIKIEAEKLIKIQAERQVKHGFAFSKDQPIQTLFEDEFIYDATLDQERCLAEIKADMESSIPMDRILCGDVGYGKTEVAFRAMFKAVLDSKQVFYLCPTTLLARQQYDSAVNRFKNYPVNIAILNRFVSASEINRVLAGLSSGKIDILFATHRGLSDDVVFKDLGLFVIDEEQRFGVVHKEKIKEIKTSVDVLTLTATPIPRTLQMAVLGIKNLSLIETPPKNRKSVITYVTPFDKKLIREIIYNELSRGGQVFILYNRVTDIEDKVDMFKRLVPDASFGFAHGKMDKDSFEKVMDDFVNKEFDVLVCTTIIETGVDIPNVNSLIIMDADRFGLSQLYQIRGRVGRSDVVAYAYLMYEKGKVLTETAVKRLKVIKKFTELGSGFAIATRDLSIRGAGDILGSEQAGFIDTVGMDMYLKMLNEETERLKGYEPVSDDDSEEGINLNSYSHIKDEYVFDEDVKIEIHKKINSIDSFDSLNEVKSLIEDRFGPCDDDLVLYMNEQLFESLTKRLGVVSVFDNNIYREIFFDKNISDKIDGESLFILGLKINNSFNFSYKNNMLSIKLLYKYSSSHVVYDFNKLLKELI